MRVLATVSQVLAAVLGAALLGLGTGIWTGAAGGQLAPVHAVLGLLLVALLWVVAAAGLRAGVSTGLGVTAIVAGAVVVVFGGVQDALVPGSWHVAIQVLHLLLGLTAVGFVLVLGRRIKRPGSTERARPPLAAGLLFRNLAFTVVVPGAGGVYGPWLILGGHGAPPGSLAWAAAPIIAAGVFLYFLCQWTFATAGRGTPGTWDPPRRLVAVGPYRWIRNPIYVAALLVVLGEAWLFRSGALLVYAGALALAFHVLVVLYEEPRLRARFGEEYERYRQTVRRWIPVRPPRTART